MKKTIVTPKSNKKKTGPGSDPENKFKKGKTTSASISNIITSATEKFKARSGKLDNEGTAISYEES